MDTLRRYVLPVAAGGIPAAPPPPPKAGDGSNGVVPVAQQGVAWGAGARRVGGAVWSVGGQFLGSFFTPPDTALPSEPIGPQGEHPPSDSTTFDPAATPTPTPTSAPPPHSEEQSWAGRVRETIFVEPTQARDRALTFAEEVSEYVHGYFAFLREEYSRSANLQRLGEAALSLVAEIARLVQGIFPFIPVRDEAPTPPPPPREALYVEPTPLAAYPIPPGREAQEALVAGYAKEILFGDKSIGEQEGKFCELIGRLVVVQMRPTVEPLKDNPALRRAFNDPRAVERKIAFGKQVATELVRGVNRGSLHRLKGQEIRLLGRYLEAVIPVIKSGSKETIFGKLASANLIAQPFQKLGPTIDYQEAVFDHLYQLLVPRLDVHLSAQYHVATHDIGSSAAHILSQAVFTQTSADAINGHFAMIVEVIKAIKIGWKDLFFSGPSAPPTPDVLTRSEANVAAGIVETFLKHLCAGQDIATLAKPFEAEIVKQINSSLSPVLRQEGSDSVALEFGLINTTFERSLDQLEHPTSTKVPNGEVEAFFNGSQTINGLAGFLVKDFVGAIQGLGDLRRALIDHPELSQNLACLIMEDAITTLFPLPTSSSSLAN